MKIAFVVNANVGSNAFTGTVAHALLLQPMNLHAPPWAAGELLIVWFDLIRSDHFKVVLHRSQGYFFDAKV